MRAIWAGVNPLLLCVPGACVALRIVAGGGGGGGGTGAAPAPAPVATFKWHSVNLAVGIEPGVKDRMSTLWIVSSSTPFDATYAATYSHCPPTRSGE